MVKGPDGLDGLVMKETGWMSNAPELLVAVSKLCPNRSLPKEFHHKHVHLVGNNRAHHCERYPPKLVAAILNMYLVRNQCWMTEAGGGGWVEDY